MTFSFQGSSALSPKVEAAMEELGLLDETGSRGAVFTRREVVDFILDLSGYTTDQPLPHRRLLEPSFGGGDFLFPAIERLMSAWREEKAEGTVFEQLKNSVRAVELHHQTFQSTSVGVIELLVREGLDADTARALSDCWLIQGDFLLLELEGSFDYVVGNPPYIRQELISAPLLAAYRQRYQTIYDRADIYIPFIERSLSSLSNGGALGFICADRWTKNRYGGPLRKMIAGGFNLETYVDMVDTPAFHSEVIAYPAITIIRRDLPGRTRIARRPTIDPAALRELAVLLRSPDLSCRDLSLRTPAVRELVGVTNGDSPWLLESSDQMSLIRRLEEQFPSLAEAGCRVGIGVATGADQAFIANFDTLDVEPDRKLPLVTTRDIVSGEVEWQGLGVINPFTESGELVNLEEFPRLRRYLESHRELIAARHCAKKSPANWYRTIDRITPALANIPKLLIPDIKGESHIVYERGGYYPHHNLYFVTADQWDLRALQAVLLSAVTRLFVATYSTKMRGGFLRFQAQYIRRLRLPEWTAVPVGLRKELAEAARQRDIEACNLAAFHLYQLSDLEIAALTYGRE